MYVTGPGETRGQGGFFSSSLSRTFVAIVQKTSSMKKFCFLPDFKTFRRLCNVCYKRHETGETSSDKFGRCENKYDITDIYIRICMYVHGYLVCIHWQKRDLFKSRVGDCNLLYVSPPPHTIE